MAEIVPEDVESVRVLVVVAGGQLYMVLVLDGTICPRSIDPFYIVTYYIKWVTTFWTDSTYYFNVKY